MNDRPTTMELVRVVREWLQNDALPLLKKEGAAGFQALIASHVLGIVEREIEMEEQHLNQEWQWLSSSLILTTPTSSGVGAMRQAVQSAHRELCMRIRQGEYDERGEFLQLVRNLKSSVRMKLAVNNPRALDQR